MENLLLTNQTGRDLYWRYACKLPIIDYHCHLNPCEIHENERFEDLGQIWLCHDHYKWRAMRTFGIDESLITGNASFYDKFMAFAKIFPFLAGNPLYIWCRLELKRYFGIGEPLCAENADDIYARTKQSIENLCLTPRDLIAMSSVEYIATTDDPIDNLCYHAALQADDTFKTTIAPTFRPDKAANIQSPDFKGYIATLSKASGVDITDFKSLITVLEARLVYFKSLGSGITDNGLDNYHWEDCKDPDAVVRKALSGGELSPNEIHGFKTAFLTETAKLYHKHGFVMQIHIGAYRNVSSRMFSAIGGDTGFDCMDSETPVRDLGKLLDALESAQALPKTILYPLNINQFESLAVLAAGFCGGGVKARVTLGAPWWFNDQPYGIKKQLESVSQLYPVALMVGMLTDSRSFLSYPRHELFRRIFCDYLGELVERGEYPNDDKMLGEIITDVCYRNAKEYFSL